MLLGTLANDIDIFEPGGAIKSQIGEILSEEAEALRGKETP